MRVDEEKVILKITDGNDQIIKINGQTPDPKLSIRPSLVELNNVIVGKQGSLTI